MLFMPCKGVHRGIYRAIYFDPKLWQEIILLKHFARGKWVVENVKPYYQPFIEPSFYLERHAFWTNFKVNTNVKFQKREVSNLDKFTNNTVNFGFDLRKYKIKNKQQILRNIVNPEIGLYLFEEGLKIKNRRFKQEQLSLFQEY